MGRFQSDNFFEVLPLTPIIPYCLEGASTAAPFCSPLLTLPTILNERNRIDSIASSFGDGNSYNSNSKLTLPILPNRSSMGLNGVQWLSETPLRQRGLRLRPDECDPDSFVICYLCGNRILGNREINLRNHARRHATLKQFQCRYCQYKHSEITKVRLHMAHKHDDARSRPINNVNAEMRQAWKALMYDCFPAYFVDACAQQNQFK